MLGSVVVSGCSGGNAGMVLGVRWRGGLLGFWVRLGGRIGVIWEEFEVLVCSQTKGRKMWIFSEEEGRIPGSLWLEERTGKKVGLSAIQGESF